MLKKMKITIGALLAVLLLATAGMVSFFYLRSEQVNQVQDFQSQLRTGLIKSCEDNGNPLREAVQSLLREQIKSSKNTTLLEKFFPQIPKSQLEKLTEASVAANQTRLREIRPLDCESLYK